MLRVAYGVVFVVVMAVAARGAGVVFWVSEPVGPGEVVMAYGGELGAVQAVLVARVNDGEAGLPGQGPATRPTETDGAVVVKVDRATDGCVKAVMPKGAKTGVYVLDVGGVTRLLNVPVVEWCQPTRLVAGLGEDEVPPGGAVQVVGRNFVVGEGGTVRAAMVGGRGNVVELKVVKGEKYSVVAKVPEGIEEGEYRLYVHNGFGGQAGWGGGLKVRVKRGERWPSTEYDVRRFGAKGDGVTDDSAAVRKALEQAGRNGGGVVTFGVGTYRVSGYLLVPPRTVVRGAGRELTWLKWPMTKPRSEKDYIPAAVISSGQVELADLSLMMRNARDGVFDLSWAGAMGKIYEGDHAPVYGLRGSVPRAGEARDIFLRNVRVHYLPFAGRPSTQPIVEPQWALGQWGLADPSAVGRTFVAGAARNVEVSGCELVGTERMLDLSNGRVVGNSFSNQMGTAWVDLGGRHLVVEGNRIAGASSFRAWGEPLRYLYVAHNASTNLERGEREAMTFDISRPLGRRDVGNEAEPVARAVASGSATGVRLRGATLAQDKYVGFDVQVVGGRGVGQYRRVVGNGADEVTVEPAWDVVPDRSSVVLLHRVQGHCVMYANRAEDTSVLGQIWGTLYDATFDSNVVERSQGMWGLSGTFVQWIGNRLDGAVSYHEGVGPAGDTPERTAEYGLLGFVASGELERMGGRFPLVVGAVIRGNELSYGHRVLVMHGYGGRRQRAGFWVAQDVVVDHNKVSHSPVGVETDPNCIGVLLNENTFEDVATPVKQWTATPR